MALQHHPRIVSNGLLMYIDAANARSYSGSGITANALVGGTGGTLVNGVGFTTLNSGVFTFYIDTISSGTYSTDTNNYSNTSYHIGGDGPPTTLYWFQGNISQTQVYNRALTSDEVLQNYNATKSRFGIV